MSIRPSSVIPDLFRDLGLFRVKSRHPGLVPGPIQTGRDLKTTLAGCFQDPEYRWGDFGTTDGNIAERFRDNVYVDTSLLRHPGLVPGPWLAPGPTQKGRDLKTTTAGCFQDPG